MVQKYVRYKETKQINKQWPVKQILRLPIDPELPTMATRDTKSIGDIEGTFARVLGIGTKECWDFGV